MKIKFKQGWSTIPPLHQQNKQPLLNTKKKTMTFADENRGPCLGHKNVGLNQLMGSQHYLY